LRLPLRVAPKLTAAAPVAVISPVAVTVVPVAESIDTVPLLTLIGALRVTVEVLEVMLTGPIPPVMAALIVTDDPVEETVTAPLPELRAEPTVTAPV